MKDENSIDDILTKIGGVVSSSSIVENDYARKEASLAVDIKLEELEGKKQDRRQRKSFSYCIFVFMCVYMAIVLTALFLAGFSILSLSETVLVTLLGTTTIDVIGLMALVARYFFPSHE